VALYSSGDTIRHARAQELAALPAVEYAADEIFRAAGIGPLPPSADIDALRNSLFVLVAGDPPFAFARVIEVDGQAHLEQMSVIPERMRLGIGAHLLEQCIHTARESGYGRLTLITFANLAWNAPFYLRHGFKPLLQLTPGLQRLREREKALKLDAIGARIVLAIDLTKAATDIT
jgi:GNAT superfamily N-acetyltransferase